MVKEILSVILRTSPIWSIPLNMFVANRIATNAVNEGSQLQVVIIIAAYLLVLLLLAVWFVSI